MKLAIFAYSRRGCALARRVLDALPDSEGACYTLARFEETGFLPIPQPSQPFYGELFNAMDALIFVGAAGIAVRSIAPHVRSKKTDPAVICLDELGTWVVPLLSGHIGGANALARTLAEALEAQCVLTTATDVNRRFSVDTWATENGYVLSSMAAAKAVSAAILEGDVPFLSSLPVLTDPAPGLTPGERGSVGIYIGWEKREPFQTTLRLVPRALHLGLGCRRGTAEEAIRAAVEGTLEQAGIDPAAICCAASIDLKKDEAGLLAFCEHRGWPIRFYTGQRL